MYRPATADHIYFAGSTIAAPLRSVNECLGRLIVVGVGEYGKQTFPQINQMIEESQKILHVSASKQ